MLAFGVLLTEAGSRRIRWPDGGVHRHVHGDILWALRKVAAVTCPAAQDVCQIACYPAHRDRRTGPAARGLGAVALVRRLGDMARALPYGAMLVASSCSSTSPARKSPARWPR
jgi:hypothetical protein